MVHFRLALPLDTQVVHWDAREKYSYTNSGVLRPRDGWDDDQAANSDEEQVRDDNVDLDGSGDVRLDAAQPQHAHDRGAHRQPQRLREVVDEIEHVACRQHQEREETLQVLNDHLVTLFYKRLSINR